VRHAAAGLLFLLSACSTYQGGGPLDQLPLPVPAEKRVEVWSKGRPHQLHALHVEGDSVVGVPWWKDPACDSCRVAIARAEVDSVRTRKFAANETGAAASVAIPFIAVPMLGLLLMLTLGMGPSD
jgi:hypothetical protein